MLMRVSPLASSAPSAPSLGGSLSLGSHSGGADPEQAWPQSTGEEDLQLQLALAMSKEEAEQVSQSSLLEVHKAMICCSSYVHRGILLILFTVQLE